MAHEGLLAGHAAFCHIDEVVHDAVLEAEEQIEIAQARIRVDENDFLAAHGEADAEVCRRRRLADTALARSDYINFAHTPYSYLSIGSMTICPSFIEARSARSVISMWSGERAMRFAMRICVGIR